MNSAIQAATILQRNSGLLNPEYQAILTRAAALGYTLPSPDQQVKQKLFISTLKSLGIWELLDVLYVFATDGDQNFATLNWKNPSVFQITRVSNPTFTVNQGFRPSGTGSYLNTGWAPSINGVNYTLNNASFGYHLIGNSQSDLFDCGTVGAAGTTTRTWASARLSTNGTQFNIQSNAALQPSGITDSNGFHHIQRLTSTTSRVFKNGVSISATATTSGSLSERPFFIGTFNNNGVPSTAIQTRTHSIFFAGPHLSGKELSFYTAWNAYLTSL